MGKAENPIRTLILVLVVAVVVTAVFSIFKREKKQQIVKRTVVSVSHKPQIQKPQNQRKESRKKTDLDNLTEQVVKLNREIYLLKVKNKLLEEQISYREKEEKLKDFNVQEFSQPSSPELEALRKQVKALQLQIAGLKKRRTEKEEGKVLKMFFKKPKNYTLIAIAGKKALLKGEDRSFWVKDGDLLDGQKVQVGSFSVIIGGKEVSLLTERNESFPQLFPQPLLRR